MEHITDFLRRAFPAQKRTILLGLGYGVLLVALNWYPLPMLLENLLEMLAPPKWLAYALIAALLCILCWFFISGKLWARDFSVVGWTAVGYLAAGIVLAGLVRCGFLHGFERCSALLISCFLLLAVYMIAFEVRQRV